MHKKESVFKRVISRTLGNKKTQSVTIPLLCVLIGLIVGAIVIAVLGKNPFMAYYNLLQAAELRRRLPMRDIRVYLRTF